MQYKNNLQTGQGITLACGHPRTVAFNDPHDTAALFFCDRCDGLRAALPVSEFGPHDARGWSPDDLLLGVYTAAELWHSTSGSDPYDVLSDRQRELLDRAAGVLAEEYCNVDPDRKTDPFRAWDTSALLVTLRAGGVLWESTGRDDPNDVLSTVQKGRLDRAALLVVTADDIARYQAEHGHGPSWQRTGNEPGHWQAVSRAGLADLKVLTEAAVLGDDSPHAAGSVSEAADRLQTLLETLPELDTP
jgi:hypothetical protein